MYTEVKHMIDNPESNKTMLWYVLIITLGILLVPSFMRIVFTQGSVGTMFPFESEPYYNMIVTQNMEQDDSNNSLFSPDTLFKGRRIVYGPHHYLLSFFSVGNQNMLQFWLWITPLFLGVIATLLMYGVLRRFSIEHSTAFMALLALVLSPSFMYVFTTSISDALAVCVLLLALYLFISPKRRLFWVSLPVIMLAASFSLFHALLVLLFLILFSLHAFPLMYHKARALAATVLVLGVIFVGNLPFYIPYTALESSLNSFVADFGARSGFSVFYIILACMGLVYSWKEKEKYVLLYVLTLLSIPAILVQPQLMIYALFILAYFVGLALIQLRQTKWQFPSVQKMTFLIIILGLLFSSVSYANRLKSSHPSEELVHSLEFLKENSPPDAKVLSHESLGPFIESLAHRPVLLDEADDKAALQAKLKSADTIFQSRSEETVRALLVTKDIRFILITDRMKEGLVWEAPDQGLLFLLRDSETFKNVYSTSSIEIWEFTP